MRSSHGGPRVLLRRLREVMAEPVSAQARLDKIVTLIAANMVAEVCSFYVMRADNMLELFATEGLKREAVHMTTMKAGEGLVGLIALQAEPMNVQDAQHHPAFSYRPETGEEIYQSFLGVPVLRSGNTLGVLVVQNRAHRLYTDEEVEALQTTAMVLAEIIAAGELKLLAHSGSDIALTRSLTLSGQPLSDGVGLGYAVLHEPRIVISNLIADDTAKEQQRIDEAVADLRVSIDQLVDRGDVMHGGEHREVLETYRMFANDPGWMRRLREAVQTGLTAEAAVERVQSDNRARMLRQTDPYLRERLHDLDELANRLLHRLLGRDMIDGRVLLPDNAILIARSMGPAALLDYDRSKLRGLVLEEGGPTSHIAIVARALGIPAVGTVENITGVIVAGDAIIVDGGAAQVQVRPQPDIKETYKEKVRLRARRQEQYRILRDVPSVTKDGQSIKLNLNAGLLIDLPHIEDTGADGIGLFRTELQFMVSARMPNTNEQISFYRTVLEAAQKKPVTFRTLDIGGDKILPYMRTGGEENPALGWRAIRIGLDRPGLLRAQLRSMLKAAKDHDLRIMFPMVATVDEFDRAKAIVEREIHHLERYGHGLPRSIKLGVMIEVPSLLFEIDEICKRADFLSVGSNDLMQFLFAADRENPMMAARFDPLSPACLRALKKIAEAGTRMSIPVTLCGELGGRPIEAMTLIGLGYRSLSMSPASIGPVKAMLIELNAATIAENLEKLLDQSNGVATLRPQIESFAQSHGIPV
ncbi:MAG: phosphoenolpyruvate--protein phosphotransferase [Alphaproteobacteria bacterium]|nr:phosphoenolpyruvate--protein phosphotransferase [Alphaproteobacteria bacterium]